jgi:hypothetical protein
MRKLLQQIKRELKTANTALFTKKNSAASGQTTGIDEKQKSRDLLRSMAFASGSIATVCAPFSIENLLNAAKSNLSTRVKTLNTHRQSGQSSARRNG